MKRIFTLLFAFTSFAAFSQGTLITNPAAEEVLKGNYDPAAYLPPVVLNHPDTIVTGLNSRISADSLQSFNEKLGSFYTRNSGSDTVSSTKGIGAARRWVYQKFQGFSSLNNNRLLAGYLQFDTLICTQGRHRSPMAILPGLDTTDPSIIIIESHIDSRCEGLCDTSCLAQGSDDNGSGTCLVMELARVMSKYSFSHTIVFITNIGEEQGLLGAEAFADYVQENGIAVRAVLNNDIVGGVLCGHTSSPPSCSPFGDIDSTQLRLFSYGGFNSPHKGLVRFIKLEYEEELLPIASVPMTVSVMTAEDRTGRGGDHIPFRAHGYTAMRFTCANENGNANVADTNYIDNQHTSKDVMGYDTDGDEIIDSFLVDFHYLVRNTAINGNGAALAAIGPLTPAFILSLAGNQCNISIDSPTPYPAYRVGVRTTTYDWDSVYTFTTPDPSITLASGSTYAISVATVDTNGIESLFSGELLAVITGVNDPGAKRGIYLLPAKPNPADEATMITVNMEKPIAYHEAAIRVLDSNGTVIKSFPMKLKTGINEQLYHHGFNSAGTYLYQLVIDGEVIDSRKMVFGN
jgi:hypothetical protein